MIGFMVSIMLAAIVAYYAIKEFGFSDEVVLEIFYPDRFEGKKEKGGECP